MIYIRRPTLHDLNACAKLDASFTTRHVWQMSLQTDSDRLQVQFHRVRLPRPMTVPSPPEEGNLANAWQRGEGMFVARQGNDILGYIHLAIDPQQKIGYIRRHVVAPAHRRQGIGTGLLDRAMEWGRERKLRGYEVELSTKNNPAIEFYLAQGFLFTGFSERLWGWQEILMRFSRVAR